VSAPLVRTQAEHVVAPPVAKVAAAQGVQKEAPVIDPEKVPAGQAEQLADVVPGVAVKDPRGQAEQIAPFPGVEDPGAHLCAD